MADEDDWYDSPRYYDLIFDEDTVNEADFLEAMMWEYGIAESGRASNRPAAAGASSASSQSEVTRQMVST